MATTDGLVSVLFNEPKLLKLCRGCSTRPGVPSFSALQRAEIAEIGGDAGTNWYETCFSALQRAEIAEIHERIIGIRVLMPGFSALQRAEIAEIRDRGSAPTSSPTFQCSSTSRNC